MVVYGTASSAPPPLTVLNVMSVVAVFSFGAVIAVAGSQLRKHARIQRQKDDASATAAPSASDAADGGEVDAVELVKNAFRVNEDVSSEDLAEVYEDLRKQLPKMFKILGQHVIAPVCVKAYDLLLH